jgi:hypothetical protein
LAPLRRLSVLFEGVPVSAFPSGKPAVMEVLISTGVAKTGPAGKRRDSARIREANGERIMLKTPWE